MESIQQIAEQFIRQAGAIDITKGLTEALEKTKQLTDTFVCRLLEHKLMEADQILYEHRNLRKGWTVEQRDVERQVLTGHGLLQFSRRYYLNRQTGNRRYLVDDLAGLEPYERVEAGLSARLCEAAADNSYQKSAAVCCGGQVSHVLSSRLSSRPLGWMDKGLKTISRLRVHVLNGGQIGPGNLRKGRKPAVRAKKLRSELSYDIYNESRILHTDHRSSSEYRLFSAIASGGRAI